MVPKIGQTHETANYEDTKSNRFRVEQKSNLPYDDSDISINS